MKGGWFIPKSKGSYSPVQSERLFTTSKSMKKASLDKLLPELEVYKNPGEFNKFLANQTYNHVIRQTNAKKDSKYLNLLEKQISKASLNQIKEYKEKAGITGNIELPSQYGFSGNYIIHSNARG